MATYNYTFSKDNSLGVYNTGITLASNEYIKTVKLTSTPHVPFFPNYYPDYPFEVYVGISNNQVLSPCLAPYRYVYNGPNNITQQAIAVSDDTHSIVGGNVLATFAVTKESLVVLNYDIPFEITTDYLDLLNLNSGRYNGSSYDAVQPYYYNGSAWIPCEWKRYNGSSWDDVDTV